MFKKILIANRGEIALRIIRACRELGVHSISLYQTPDRASLHVRLADEAVLLESPQGFMDISEIIRIAREYGADAIHPGYGFLAEEAEFVQACDAAGIVFIGPPAGVIRSVRDKIACLETARMAGISTVNASSRTFDECEMDALRQEAERLGYPLVVKSCRGGRGRGERLVIDPAGLEKAVQRSQFEAQAVYGDRCVYLEKAISHAHQIGVQILADFQGNIVHFGEREGSVIHGNQKIIEESPAPGLSDEQRRKIWDSALALGRLCGYQNAGTVEFLVDQHGELYFTEIKARIQIEHPLTEMLARVDLVKEQIRIAAGFPLGFSQADIRLAGWAIQCRISAEDPWNNFMPSPGRLKRVRLPGGPEIRVDTYVYDGCNLPAEYDSLIAKLIVWGQDRPACLARLKRALEEFKLLGPPTNLPMLQRVICDETFVAGEYDTGFSVNPFGDGCDPDHHMRDLAIAVALIYDLRNQAFRPTLPSRIISGWHRDSRRVPD